MIPNRGGRGGALRALNRMEAVRRQLGDYLTAPVRETAVQVSAAERRARIRAMVRGDEPVAGFGGLSRREVFNMVLTQRRALEEQRRMVGIRTARRRDALAQLGMNAQDIADFGNAGNNLEMGAVLGNRNDIIVDVEIPPQIDQRGILWQVLAGTLRQGATTNRNQIVFQNAPIYGPITVELYYGLPNRPTNVETFFLDVPADLSRVAYRNWFQGNMQWSRGRYLGIRYPPEGVAGVPTVVPDDAPTVDSADITEPPSRIIVRRGNVNLGPPAIIALRNNFFADDYIRDTHCFFQPIIDFFAEKCDDSTLAASTLERYSRLLRLASSYEKKYRDGIPEPEVEKVAKQLQVGILLRDVFENKIKSYNLPDAEHLYSRGSNRRNVVKSFSFTFVRHNHLEIKNSKAGGILRTLARLMSEAETTTDADRKLFLQQDIAELETKMFMSVFGGYEITYTGSEFQRKRARDTETRSSVLLSDSQTTIDVSSSTLQRLFEFCHKYDVFTMFRTRKLYSGGRDVRSLVTTAGTFRVKPKHSDITSAFNESIGLKFHLFHYDRHKHITDLVASSFKVRNTLKFRNLAAYDAFAGSIENVYELDMKRAYAQFKAAGPYFVGFPSRFVFYEEFDDTPVTKSFLETRIGVFTVKVVAAEASPNQLLFLEQLGFQAGKTVTLPTPEISFLIDNGVKFSLVKGTWCTQAFSFEFSEAMMTNRTDPEESPNGAGVPLYSYWTGMGAMMDRSSVFYVSCDEETANDFASLVEGRFFYDKHFSSLRIIQNREPHQLKNWIQVSAFITSYARINVLRELFKLNFEDVVGLKLDSIVVVGDTPRQIVLQNPLFREKPPKIFFSSWSDEWYEDEGAEACAKILPAERIPLFTSYTELLGSGGSGKTHAILADKRYVDPLYVSFTNLLCHSKHKEYGCETATFHKLLGMDTQSYLSERGSPGIILLDEITMVPGKWIREARELYPKAVIFAAGDIEPGTNFCYQTTMDDASSERAPLSTQVAPGSYLFTTDYRSKCDFLRELKVKMRAWMQEHMFEPQNKTLAQAMWREFSYDFEMTIAQRYLKDFFRPGDVILCGRNNVIDSLTEGLEAHGIAPVYRKIKSDSASRKGRKFAGEILDSPEANTRKQLAFTTHSVQGMTVESPRKLFLFVNDFFSPQVLYTAVSRAQYMIQICAVT